MKKLFFVLIAIIFIACGEKENSTFSIPKISQDNNDDSLIDKTKAKMKNIMKEIKE